MSEPAPGAARGQEPAGIPFGISEPPGLPVDLSAYMDYVLTFFQDRLARGKANTLKARHVTDP